MTVVHFTVVGEAQPAGSKRAVPTSRDWRTRPGVRWQVLDANKNADGWKQIVKQTAAGRMLSLRAKPFDCPLVVQLTFRRARPKSHLLTDGVKLSSVGRQWAFPSMAPDVLKLARAVEDAMTGTVYTDDALIVTELIGKEWGDRDEVEVNVFEAVVERTFDERGQ